MLTVLIVNENKKESHDWSDRLSRTGYCVVGECGDIAEMVHVLGKEKVHIIICAANLIKKSALVVLKEAMDFFPRVKIVVVGNIIHELLSNMPLNIVFKKNFDCDLDKYYSPPVENPALLLNEEKKNITRQQTAFLLNEHFLSYEEAARLLAKAQPKWQPGYVVISVLSDSFAKEIFQIASGLTAETKNAHTLQLGLEETCIILEDSPSMEKCLGLAESLRLALLKETDASFSIGLSRERYLAGELFVCRKEALRAASATYLFGQNSVIHINYLDPGDILYVYPKHKEKRLIEQALDGNAPGALRMLDEIFEVLRNCKNLNQGFINKIGLRILVGLNIAAAARVQELEKIQMDSVSTGKLLAAKSIDDTYLFLKQAAENFAAEMDAITDLRRDVLFMELTKLKKEKGALTVRDLTKAFQSSVFFLNSTVMKNSGGSIFEFLGE